MPGSSAKDLKTACLVTGCAGFVGSHLTEALLGLGLAVVGVDNFFSGHRRNMAGFEAHPGFSFLEKNILEPEILARAVDIRPGLAHVFHLAAIVSVPYSLAHPDEVMAVNHQASVDLFDQARARGLASFVFAGSAAEYGDCESMPLAESDAGPNTRQTSPYGRAKYLCSRHVEQAGFGSSLRFFNIYGPRQDPESPYSGVVSRFIDQGLSGRPLTVFGDGGQSRDFLFVRDSVRAYVAAAGLGRVPVLSGVFNVGTGTSTTILGLAEAVRRLTKNRAPLSFLPQREGDVRRSLAEVSRFERAAGFKAQTGLDKGLARTVAWARAQRGSA
ncbi:MAG: NAD-dependent epimerase/dehydratase family protein [Desulfovibrionaceae bacterium]|nr:NAD-dependent epimerase/dehydratase family protein [Desulfovibrionaceae bacterium]